MYALRFACRRLLRSEPKGSREHVGRLQRHLFYLAFFCYPLVAPVVVSIFRCRAIDGVRYLEAFVCCLIGVMSVCFFVNWYDTTAHAMQGPGSGGRRRHASGVRQLNPTLPFPGKFLSKG